MVYSSKFRAKIHPMFRSVKLRICFYFQLPHPLPAAGLVFVFCQVFSFVFGVKSVKLNSESNQSYSGSVQQVTTFGVLRALCAWWHCLVFE